VIVVIMVVFMRSFCERLNCNHQHLET
jgi:hypothetical protein